MLSSTRVKKMQTSEVSLGQMVIRIPGHTNYNVRFNLSDETKAGNLLNYNIQRREDIYIPKIKIDTETLNRIGMMKYDAIKKELPKLMASFASIIIRDISIKTVSDLELPKWKENVLELKVEGKSEEIMKFWDILANKLEILVSIRW